MKINRKFVAGVVATISAFGLIITGTFTWSQTANVVNEFTGTSVKDVLLHDDFDGVNKDVYVENEGADTLYVRVQLNEVIDLTQNVQPTPLQWETHIPGMDTANCTKPFHDNFTWEMAGQKWYMPGVEADTKVYVGTEENVKQTPNAEVITMSTYAAKSEVDQKNFIGWIYDIDGYAYWSQPLEAKNATGLLLNKVITSPNILDKKDYYYAIDVRLEVVDKKDIPMWTEGKESVDGSGTTQTKATSAGILFLKMITNS